MLPCLERSPDGTERAPSLPRSRSRDGKEYLRQPARQTGPFKPQEKILGKRDPEKFSQEEIVRKAASTPQPETDRKRDEGGFAHRSVLFPSSGKQSDLPRQPRGQLDADAQSPKRNDRSPEQDVTDDEHNTQAQKLAVVT